MLYLTLVSALAATPPPPVGGDTTDDYPAVVYLFLGSGTCSGALIAPSWVLTAAHCIKGNDSPGQITAYVGSRPDAGELDDMARVDAAWYHPDYVDSLSRGVDVGQAHLAAPLDTVQPMPLSRQVPQNGWAGRDVRYVGYGVTSEEAGNSGTKRTVVVPFYQLDEHWIYTYDPGHNMCWGDSGGPAFIEEDGQLAVAGIISWVGSWDDPDRPCSTGWGSSTRMDTVIDWIESYTAFSTPQDTGGVAPWDTGLPEAQDSGLPVDVASGDEERGGRCSTAPLERGAWLALLPLLGVRRRRVWTER